MIGVPRNGVSLSEHNEKWVQKYERAKAILKKIHEDNIIDIEHVGSTAIKGIVAKPLIDIAIILKDISAINIKGMTKNGYDYCGEAGVAGRCFFVLRGQKEMSLQHVHCYLNGSRNFINQVNFRDFICSHPKYAKEYEMLKQDLYKKYPNDRKSYSSGKQAFFDKIERIISNKKTLD